MGSISGDDLSVCGDGPSAHEEKIFVAVRLRPLNEKEITRNDLSDWEPINNNTVLFKNTLGLPERSLYPTAYTFDRVFGYEASTKQVYEEGAKRIALSVVSGINSSIFAYGQTSSGKTYTMSGITEYAVADIYDCIRKQKDREFVVKFSAIEIYNECVRDLLNSDSTQLRLLDDPEKGTVIEKLTEVTLRDWNHLKELLSVCEAERQIGETALNEMSSRSHQIIRLTVESSARQFLGADSSSTLTATVNFVDLAGSERASQTMSAGTRLKEGCHINRSLLTLGTVVRKLSKGRNGHVPYRDSKLTRILQNSLGGNARTAMICTMSPARSHVEQSRNTLLFAVCAKEVSNNAQVNVVMSEKALVKQLQRELARLENELRNLGSAKSSSSHDSASMIIKEKELLIEKMEKEIRELTEQRDLAQSRLEHLLRSARNNQLLEKGAWLDEHSSSGSSEVIDPLTSSMFHISVKHEPQLLENPDDHYFSDEISPRLVMNKYFGPGLCMDWEKISDQKPNHEFSQDNSFKEVRSIEMIPNMDKELNAEENLSLKEIHDDNNDEDNESVSDVDTYETYEGLERKTEKYMHRKVDSFCGHYRVEPSPCSSDTDISDTRSISLSRSRSCRAILTTMSSPSYEKEEVHEIDFPARIEAYKVELTESKPEEGTRALSRNASRVSGRNVFNEETGKHSKAPSEGEIGNIYLSSTATRLDQGAKPEAELIADEVKVKETEIDIEEPEKVLEEGNGSLCVASNWPFEFERQRREIIELWDTCNTPLIHRTYFFLLFKGDPSDAVYMEVELRRLSFLKNTLSCTLSARFLNRERATLSKKLAKKFSSKERDSLYEKWGIDLDSKSRKVQLSRLLWTDTKNIGHVKDSAEIVAKLVGFMETSETRKEMFGLSFAPRAEGLRKSSWTKSMPSLI